MSVTVFVKLQAQSDKFRQLQEGITAMVPEALAYDGCEGVTMYQDQEGSTILLVEPWASRAHHERYLAWRTERGEIDAVVALLTGPPSITFFDRVDV